ncbi:hypothetical protein AB0H00_11030 [Nocardia sp. NPDC023852]
MKPEELPGRGNRATVRVANRPILMLVEDNPVADAACDSDPGELDWPS